MNQLRVLVVGEVSGKIRDAFHKRGHFAISCDLNLPMSPGWHIQKDVRKIENISEFDLLIAHPECTFLCNSGVKHLHTDTQRWVEMAKAADFFRWLLMLKIPMICVENPVIHGYAKRYIGIRQSQTIQPYNFNEDVSKRTCFWLKGLKPLENTGYFPPKIIQYKGRMVKRWGNQSPCGADKRGPSANRSIDRAITLNGIADAMANQWG